MNVNDVLLMMNVVIIVGYLIYRTMSKKRVINHQEIIQSDEQER